MRKQCCRAVLIVLLLASHSAWARADEKKSEPAPASMTIEEARTLLQSQLKDFWFFSGAGAEVTRVEIKPTKIGLVAKDNRYHWYDFKKFTEVKTQHHLAARSIDLRLWTGDRAEILLKGYSEESVNRLANAFTVLIASVAVPPPPDKDPAFQTIVNNYRSATEKLVFPEEARRFKVQAEAAVNEKRFDDAQDGYREALEIAPWWPEGHFNRALVLAELNEFPTAEVEMQRYLALVPDAPDARAAQDKIYIWEAKANSAQDPGSSVSKKLGKKSH